ncbi:hypothetical protein I5M27_12100 [Adhaeribacter sp. BT258]|uniref:AsmA-like C-terminal domain-containing protein n=1 Tax=Adhaeribacter terrigena TaxID=2793070 RepID=A0ABS1C330_9BACT|nr:hypothetical protein [Adhaeribacter terrigena]MBK0403733.1 hypothetical protein [Adhaeribacter terrigena]
MLEILLWLNGLILLLVLLIGIGFQIPAVQTFTAQKATAFLSAKLKTRVTIGRFTTDWRNSVVLKEIYIEDQQNDTLLYAGRLGLDFNILGTTSNRLKIRSVKIDDGSLRIYSNLADSSYNFSFIGEAFSGSGKTDSSSSFSLNIVSLQLQNLRLQLTDPVRGNFGTARIGKFTMHADAFETQTKTYELGNMQLQNSNLSWRKTKRPGKIEQDAGHDFTFRKINLGNLKIDLRDETIARRLTMKVGKAALKADKIALENARADLSKFTFENADIQYYKLKPAEPLLKTDTIQQESLVKPVPKKKQDWAIWLHDANFQNLNFQYHDLNAPALKRGIDFNHLFLKNTDLKLSNLYYSQSRVSGIVDALQLLEKSGFRVKNLQGNVKAGTDFLELKEVILKTNNSQIRAVIDVKFAPLRKITGIKTTFTAQLHNARFSPRDLLFLAPDLAGKPFYRKLGNNLLLLNGRVSGHVRDLQFQHFTLKGWTGTHMLFSGQVKDIQLENSRSLRLQIRKLNTNRKDLNVIMANGKSAPKFRFPDQLSLTGNLQNQVNKLSFQNLYITGSNGLVLQTNGNVTGPVGKKHVDLQVKKLVVSRQGLLNMLPPGAITPEVQLPENVQFAGTYQGSSLQHFAVNGHFRTTFGNVFANVKIEPVQRFAGHISLDNFDLGKLLKLENMLGPATGSADFKGKGFKVQTMVLHYDANVKKFVYRKDTYRNIRLEGNLNEKIYKLNGNLANAALQGLGHKLKKIKPGNINLKKADPTRFIPKKIEPKKIIPKFLRKKKKREEAQKQ